MLAGGEPPCIKEGETESPRLISGIVGESISGFLMTRVILNPKAIEPFPQGKKLFKIKPIMGPLRGFVFSEAPTPSGLPLAPTPVHVYPGAGRIPWYGPGGV